ncbi:hypothetical protein [Streptomyces sp. KL116D]
MDGAFTDAERFFALPEEIKARHGLKRASTPGGSR